MSEHELDAILLRHFLCDRIAFCIVISSLRLAEVPKSVSLTILLGVALMHVC